MSREVLSRFTDAAAETVARTIVDFQRETRRERELRDAQFSARMAELGSKISSVDDLVRRLAERLETLKDGSDGESVTIDDARPVIVEYVERVLAGWDRPKDGLSVTVDDVEPILRDMVNEVVAKIPAPKDGRDGVDGTDGQNGKDADPDAIRRMIAEAVALVPIPADGRDGKDGADGRDVDIDDVRKMIADEVSRIPAPKNGRDGRDGADGASVDPAEIERMISEAVAALPPAAPGKDADPELVADLVSEKVREAIDALPPPKKGEKGDPGPMGSLAAVEDYQDRVYYQGEVVTLDGAIYQAVRDTGKVPGHQDWRCIVRRGADGQEGRSFAIRGTYQLDGEYHALDVVALNGASFAAKRDNPGPCPGDGWQLIASQGKQGKPGVKGDRGERGLAGPGVARMSVNDDGLVQIVNGDGSAVDCDFYPVLSKLGG